VPRHLLLAGAFLALAGPAFADNWPQWRGPKNDGLSPEKGLPTEFGPDKNVAWKTKLPGRGSSTPCVWGGHIFLTATDGKESVLLCYGTDGQEKWQKPMGPGRAGFKGAKGGKGGMDGEGDDASASCSTDGKHVWAFVGTGKLACFDFAGTQVWETNLQSYGKFAGGGYGIHWTPVLYKGRLYVQVFHRWYPDRSMQKLIALDAATGKEVWAVDRKGYGIGESPDTYASAFVWEGDGGPLLIAHGNDFCTAHKLDTGDEVWRVMGLNPGGSGAWRFVSCPLVTPDLIVVPSCKNGPTVGLNPVGAKGAIEPGNPAELWRLKETPDVISPLRVGEIVYLMRDGPLTAVEAKTGTQIYRKDLAKQIHRANMAATADGLIYVVGREGAVDVVQAGREFKQVAANALPDKFYASPAIANGRLYLRGWDHLWAIGTK
jgi:outer membrane protein assembly factor BamB